MLHSLMCLLPVFSSKLCSFGSCCLFHSVLVLSMLWLKSLRSAFPGFLGCHSGYIPSCPLWQHSHRCPAFPPYVPPAFTASLCSRSSSSRLKLQEASTYCPLSFYILPFPLFIGLSCSTPLTHYTLSTLIIKIHPLQLNKGETATG